MKIGAAFPTALAGLQSGMRRLEQNTAEVARAAGDPTRGAPVEPLVESRLDQRHIEANAKMVAAADEMLGTLLDEEA